jgi:hypothetical protein
MTQPAFHAPAQDAQEYDALVTSLFEELNQTERSAKRHCAREADRLGDTPPAAALYAVSRHAERVLTDLSRIAMLEDLTDGTLGLTVGELFTNVRHLVTDRVLESERSYRATLLGCRHGVDVVRFLRFVAEASGRSELAAFCARWLDDREPLVAELEAAMSWFARRPRAARKRATMKNGNGDWASRITGTWRSRPSA